MYSVIVVDNTACFLNGLLNQVSIHNGTMKVPCSVMSTFSFYIVDSEMKAQLTLTIEFSISIIEQSESFFGDGMCTQITQPYSSQRSVLGLLSRHLTSQEWAHFLLVSGVYLHDEVVLYDIGLPSTSSHTYLVGTKVVSIVHDRIQHSLQDENGLTVGNAASIHYVASTVVCLLL